MRHTHVYERIGRVSSSFFFFFLRSAARRYSHGRSFYTETRGDARVKLFRERDPDTIYYYNCCAILIIIVAPIEINKKKTHTHIRIHNRDWANTRGASRISSAGFLTITTIFRSLTRLIVLLAQHV